MLSETRPENGSSRCFPFCFKYAFDKQIKEDALFNFAKTAYELSYDPYNEAVSAFEEYIDKNPDSERVDEAYEFLLQIYLTTKNYESAINAIDKIKQKTDEQKRFTSGSATRELQSCSMICDSKEPFIISSVQTSFRLIQNYVKSYFLAS